MTTLNSTTIAKIIKNSAYGVMGLSKRPGETEEEFVIRMLKGDFEKHMEMPYSTFEAIRRHLVDNHPEKLI